MNEFKDEPQLALREAQEVKALEFPLFMVMSDADIDEAARRLPSTFALPYDEADDLPY